jgi:hypothetical protein
MTPSTDLRHLAEWAAFASRWLEHSARVANDDASPLTRTVTFQDAAALDQLLTGFRRLPEIMEDIADQVERHPTLSVIAGGKR